MNGVSRQVPLSPPWRLALAALGLVLLAVLLLYRETFLAMVAIWNRSGTFAHAWLVPPIALWLVWRLRAELALLSPRPQPWILLPMAAVAAMWMLGDLAGVNAVTQFAATGLLILAVPLVLGLEVAQALLFPLVFLFFMVPFGEFTTERMMEWTADFTVQALLLVGVPVLRDGFHFVIPSGSWSVVEACSGVRYLIASFMVGSLFAYLNYVTPWKRWAFAALSIAVPIVANWIRAFLIVMLGHLSSNKLATGVDHLVYGWLFFGLVIGLMFMLGARFAEVHERSPSRAAARPAAAIAPGAWVLVALVAVAFAAAPHLVRTTLMDSQAAGAVQLAPPEIPGTAAAVAPEPDFAPVTEHAAAIAAQRFVVQGLDVTIHLAYYRAQTYGAKMTSSNNVLVGSTNNVWRRQPATVAHWRTSNGDLPVVAAEVSSGSVDSISGRRVLQVRQLYWVDGHFTMNRNEATARVLWSRLTGHGDDGAIVTVFADGGSAVAAQLDALGPALLPAIDRQLQRTRDAR